MQYDTHHLRNVVLLGHPGSGKTTLAECMLYEAGAIPRRGAISEANTVSDYTQIERDRQNSLFTTLLHAKWKSSKINILDTPGFDDFVGEILSALKVADTAIMLLHARNGVEVGTELIWDTAKSYQTPTLLVVNHLDDDQADYERTLEQARDRFGSNVLPVQYPLRVGAGFNSIIDALRLTMYVFKDVGGKPEKQAIPPEEMDRAMSMHNALVEAAAEIDEALMERFFDEGSLTEEELATGLRAALAQQQIIPVFCCSADRNMGSGRIMGFVNDICPSPADRPAAQLEDGAELPCSSDDTTTAFVFKTISEPRVGTVSYFKVYSGMLRAGEELVNASNGNSERISQLYEANGKDRESINAICAGDIGVTVKLKDVKTNDTLNRGDSNRRIQPIVFPESRIREAILPGSKAEMEKLIKALHAIEAEDPTLILEQAPTLKQTLIHGQGRLHLDLVKYRIEKMNQLQLQFTRPRIAYRETITKAADAIYRHKKQTGGAGQFAEVHLRIEPYTPDMPNPEGLTVRDTSIEELPWGGTLAFYWCVVGGTIDSKYSNAIKKGILMKMEEGPLTGSNCQDIRVSIYDGKMHSVDSNDMAFMLAAGAAFRDAFKAAAPQLLEPIYALEVLCAEDVLGDVMSDLQTRRAIITGMDTEGHYQKVMARVPQREMYQYSATLRALSQGKAKFSRHLVDYQAVPTDIQLDLISAHESESAEI